MFYHRYQLGWHMSMDRYHQCVVMFICGHVNRGHFSLMLSQYQDCKQPPLSLQSIISNDTYCRVHPVVSVGEGMWVCATICKWRSLIFFFHLAKNLYKPLFILLVTTVWLGSYCCIAENSFRKFRLCRYKDRNTVYIRVIIKFAIALAHVSVSVSAYTAMITE